MTEIPVYAFTGFLDSGKTKFIQETLEDERFNAGERTLLLVFEEGEEEFDFSTYPHQNVFLEVLDQETVTEKDFKALMKKHRPERIVAELNGMQLVGDLYARFPAEWVIAQEVMFADSTTFLSYNANMRNLVMDKLTGAQMVVFNRLEKGADIMPFHKLARAASRRLDIMYEFTDGSTQFDDIEDPLPFDINAPVIEVGDDDYALWFRDVSEEPGKYQGKTVRFKAQVAMLRRDKNGMFAPRPVRHDLLCGRHPVLWPALPLCRIQGSGVPLLGHGGGHHRRREAPPVQGRPRPRAHRRLRHSRRPRGGGCVHILISLPAPARERAFCING